MYALSFERPPLVVFVSNVCSPCLRPVVLLVVVYVPLFCVFSRSAAAVFVPAAVQLLRPR